MLNIENRTTSSCADELRAAISGRVALPGDELYEGGRRVWNGAVRRRPAIIAFSRQPEDVQAAVRAARRHGLVRGGGHDWAGRALSNDGLVIDLTGMRMWRWTRERVWPMSPAAPGPRMWPPPPVPTAWSRQWATAARSAWPG